VARFSRLSHYFVISMPLISIAGAKSEAKVVIRTRKGATYGSLQDNDFSESSRCLLFVSPFRLPWLGLATSAPAT